MKPSRIVITRPADPFAPEISARLEQMRAKANADKTVNEFRKAIGYNPAESELTVIVGALKVLSIKAKELVSHG